MGTPTAACSGCTTPLLVSAGNAVVIEGRVQQVCDACARTPQSEWKTRCVTPPPLLAAPPSHKRGPRGTVLVALGAACVALAPASPGPSANGRPNVLSVEPTLRSHAARHLTVVPQERPRQHPLSMSVFGEELTWYHPLAGERVMPESSSRRFGAERTGTRAECGAGHCGVDLGYASGPVVHAVAEGYVERIVRSGDDKGGRYVKLGHPDGLSSFYMHLDQVHPDLEVGAEVSPGDPLGTIGRSGIQHSSPHLHFAVTLEDRAGARPRFVDPEPMLREAIVLEHDAPFPH